jgi:transcriptional regulator with XRE-family HTH domain
MLSVDGAAFNRARLACRSHTENLLRGEYGYGSQEWLAEKARLSPRTVNELETGRATLKTVDAVSAVLGVKGREYILGYGEEFTTLRAPGVVDFRPSINGRESENKNHYLDDSFLITLDPLAIKVDDDFIDNVTLQQMKLKLSVGELNLDLDWIYKVQLTSRSNTWLGDEEDVHEITIHTNQPYQVSIMFRQNYFNSLSWRDFIGYIKNTDDTRILLTLTLIFEHFEKTDNIIVSVEELKNLLELSFPHGLPFWVQPNALMV